MKDLSIVIPMYNHEEYIEECLNSITKGIKGNVEIIVIDDGSTDKSLSKVRKWKNQNKKYKKLIRIFKNKKNLGCPKTLEKGISKARGTYIGVQSSDDFVDKNFYKKMLYQALKTNADIVVSDIAIYHNEKKIKKASIYEDNIYTSTMSIEKNTDSIHELKKQVLMGHWACASSSNKIIKKELLQKHPYKGKHANDLMAILPIIEESQKIIYIPNLFKYYRMHPQTQLSSCKTLDSYLGTLDSVIETMKYFYKKNEEFSRIFFYNNCLTFFFASVKKLKTEEEKIEFTNHFRNGLEKISKDLLEVYKHSLYHSYFFDNSNFNYKNYDNLIVSTKYFIENYHPKKENEVFNPLVSIIIPVYNGENYVKEAIDSALNQTYKNIEIIVVNDGSTDKTHEIIKSYKDKIKYIKKKNGGVASALNTAIKSMKGEYFSWLSHDDMYYKTKIEDQIKYLAKEKDKNIILYSDNDVMDKDGIIYRSSIRWHRDLIKQDKYSVINGNINGITLLIPKKVFDENGLFETKYKTTQDYEYWNKILYKYKFYHVDKPLAKYRVHENQDTQKNKNTIPECNKLWIKIYEDIPIEIKEKYRGTSLKFDISFQTSLRKTNYEGAIKYIEKHVKNELEKFKISIILFCDDDIEKTIQSIKSVEQQSFTNWELIVIDNNYIEDNTKLLEYIKNNKKIKYFQFKEPKNKQELTLKCIKDITGDYISFLDSNSTFHKDKLLIQLTEMLRDDKTFSHTNYNIVEENTPKEINTSIFNGKCSKELIKNCYINLSTVMIKKEAFTEEECYQNDILLYINLSKKYSFLAINNTLTNTEKNNKNQNTDNQKLEELDTIINLVTNDEKLRKNYYEVGILYKKYIDILDKSLKYEPICNIDNSKDQKSIIWRLKRNLLNIKNRGIILSIHMFINSKKQN